MYYKNCKIIKICKVPLKIIVREQNKIVKLSKGNELKTEMSAGNRITPIFTGPGRSEEDECASPILKMRGDSIELYNY